ncbi:hypothetical protein SS50377_23885 [Spironucleus salmonicida]|uniref:Uncharacterized protein n=1 Tax=Spironucleus salmonicida TaxID=348837 RepID=A0A9P8RYL9_9EUKA|nr:hypothetical protein SS50377_23885 [Spironucleus salmonicida]
MNCKQISYDEYLKMYEEDNKPSVLTPIGGQSYHCSQFNEFIEDLDSFQVDYE